MTEEVKEKKKRRLLGFVVRLLLGLLLLILLLVLLLQLSGVQNYIANNVATSLGKTTDSEINIGKVDISLSKGVVLNDFSIVTADKDTMLKADAFSVGLGRSLMSLYANELDLKDVDLQGPVLHIKTKKGDRQSNMARFLSKLLGPRSPEDEASSGGDPLNIDLKKVQVSDAYVDVTNENNNTYQSYDLMRASVTVDKIDANGNVDIGNVFLDNPVIRIKKLLGGETVIEENTVKVEQVAETDTSVTRITVADLIIEGGIFSYDDMRKEPLSSLDQLDYNHFEFSNIDLDVKQASYSSDMDIAMVLDHFSFSDDKGFVVEEIRSDKLLINDKEIALDGFSFRSPKTRLKDNISLSYNSMDDFSDFSRKVRLSANIDNSQVYLEDIIHFVHSMERSPFFKKNRNRLVKLDGRISGPIDQLRGKDLRISIGDDLQLVSNFTSRNLTKKNSELINFGVKELKTDVNFLKEFIPGFSPPDNFYKLGNIDFRGRFDGYFEDFVAYGSVNTDLGSAFMDMRLDIKGTDKVPNYSGDLSLENFDLARWTDSEDLGPLTFSIDIEEGRGLQLSDLETKLNGVVESLTYKGYEYRDFVMDGEFTDNRFNGEFSITDENIDLVFDGNMELREGVPYLDFKATVEKIDFAKINLSKDPLLVKGNLDINGNGKDLNDLLGNANASKLYIAANDTIYTLDTLNVSSDRTPYGRRLSLYSELASIDLDGNYDLKTVAQSFQHLLYQNYTQYAQSLGMNAVSDPGIKQDVVFDIHVKETKNLMELAGVDDLKIRDLKIKGKMNTGKDDLSFAGTIPYFALKDNEILGTSLLLTSNADKADLYMTFDSTRIGGLRFNPIDIQSNMKGDTVEFYVGTADIANELKKLAIEGQLVPIDKGYALQLKDREINMLGERWMITKDNEVVLGKEYLDINNLRLTDGQRSIIIDDVGNKGVSLYLADFNFKTLDQLINYDKMSFEGKGDLSVFVNDLYAKKRAYEANLFVNDFLVNKQSFGTLELDIAKPDDKPADVYVALGKDGKGLTVDGIFDPERDNYLDLNVKADSFQMVVFEYLLKDGISDVTGGIHVDGTVKGPVNDLKIDGAARVVGSSLIVDYTGVEYYIDDQRATVSETDIDFTGAVIKDANGGEGLINGGLYHNMFKDFGVNATITGDNVIAVNTTKAQNPLYYGFVKADIAVEFLGLFELLEININGESREGTIVNIPISNDKGSLDQGFIEFINSDDLFGEKGELVEEDFKIEGINVNMDLSLTEDAEINLIFDEVKGDIIRGEGRGDLNVRLSRYGDFEIYGKYDIEEGEYLFTAAEFIAKPFEVRRGSVIEWTGDPINADINIQADYSVRTPLNIFLEEYVIPGSAATAEFNNRTQVDLILNIGGKLFNPEISFDLEFPNVTGEIASYTENKMRTLRANQADLNQQVLGLMLVNNFLSTNGATGGTNLGATGVNTISEFLSSQISIMGTDLLNELLKDSRIIANMQLDVGLNKNTTNGINDNNDLLPDEFEVNLQNRFRFLDERLSLAVGGNYVRQSALRTASDYLIGDFVLEYYLTADRRFKLKAYGKYDYDENNTGYRQNYGIGLGYRTEFGSLMGLEKAMKQDTSSN